MYNQNKYLIDTLLPLIKGTEIKTTDSDTLKVFGFNNMPSTQSFLVQMGYVFEKFWNKVISNSNCKNHIEDNKEYMIKLDDGTNKQVDIFFTNEDGSIIYYFECKTNVNFDSEKNKVSNQKIKNIEKHLRKNKSKYSDNPDADIVTGYFVPVVPKISRKFKTRYRETGIYGVWIQYHQQIYYR